VHPAGGSWGAPVILSTGLGLDESDGGLVTGTDGAGNVIAGWSTNPGDVTTAVLRAGNSTWGPATTVSVEGRVGRAHGLSLAVNSGGSAIITFNGGLNNLWAVSGTVTGGFSAPVMLASGAGSNHYNRMPATSPMACSRPISEVVPAGSGRGPRGFADDGGWASPGREANRSLSNNARSSRTSRPSSVGVPNCR